MATVSKENSVWIQWVRTAATLVFGQRFPLRDAGVADRVRINASIAACGLQSPDLMPEAPCWWDVQLFGWTATQVLTAADVPTLQDPRTVGVRNVPLLGYVRYNGNELIFDVGAGAHFSVFASDISVGVIGPTIAFLVGNQGQTNFPAATPIAPVNVSSAQVDGIISACAFPVGNSQLKLTQVITVTAGTSQDIAVPAGARTLQIFQETATLPAAPLNWFSDATTVFDLGEIDFDAPVAPGRTSILEVPGMATIVRTGVAGRVMTFVWGLAP